MFNNSILFSQHQSSLLTPCTSHIFNKDGNDSFPRIVFFSTSIAIVLLPLVTVAGNALILAAVWRNNFVRTPFHILLSGLAFTDLCTGIVAQPFYSVTFLMCSMNSTVVYDSLRLLTALRTIGVGSGMYFIAVTVLILTVISIERWLVISHRSFFTQHRACFTIIALMLAASPTVILRVLENVDIGYGRSLRFMLIANMLSSYLVITMANFKVYRSICRHQRQIQDNTTIHNFGRSAINVAKYKKSVTTLVYVVLAFSLCFFPYVISVVIYFGFGNRTSETYSAFRVTVVFVFLSSAINPALYLWRMNDIRNGVIELFCRV